MTKTVFFVRCILFTLLSQDTCGSKRVREEPVDILASIRKSDDYSGILYSVGPEWYTAFEVTSRASINGEQSAEYFIENSLSKDFAITTILRMRANSSTLFAVVSPYGINQFGVDLAKTVKNSESQTAVTIYYKSDTSRNNQRSDGVLAVFYLPDISNQWTVIGIKVKGTTIELFRDCNLVDLKTTLQRDQLVFMTGSTLYLASINQNNKFIGDLMAVNIHYNPDHAYSEVCENILSVLRSGDGEDIVTDDEDLIILSGSGSGDEKDIDTNDEDIIEDGRNCTSTQAENGEKREPGQKVVGCPNDTDYLGIPWKRGIAGMYMSGHCPTGTRSGWAERCCDENGIYHDPVYNCTQPEIADIYNKLFYDKSETNGISSILDDLVNATNTRTNNGKVLLIGDIEAVIEMLSKLTDVVQANSSDIQDITNSFIQVANNLMEENVTKTWKVMMNQRGSGADAVIDKLDIFVKQVVTAPDSKITSAIYAKTNLMLKINTNVSCDRDIQFPNRNHDVVPTWAIDTLDSVKVPCLQNDQKRQYSSVMYRDVSGIVPATVNGNKSQLAINAPVISFTYYPNIVGKLEEPIETTFQVYNTTFESPRCSFWTRRSSGLGFWSDEGCWLHSYDKAGNRVICKCNHLTNFAVLMSPAVITTSKDSSHHVALSIISLTGCIISMICLFLTVVIHVVLWRKVKSVRSIIHMNLASALFLAYLLFLTGINRTENKGVCTAIAVLLHLLYLIVFFIMLTEGLVLAYTVLKPLSSRKPGIPLLVTGYALSVVVVGISMTAVELEGYGNESFCWLSTHLGLIWAFITPVLFVIVINGVIICIVIRRMCGTAAMSRKTPKEKARSGLRSVLVLMPIMGVTWVFGIFSVNEDAVIFQYLFAIFNSLQGLLIFIFHCVMNRKVQEGLKRMIGWPKFKSTSVSSSADTQSSNKKIQATKDTYI